jgi:hypothetical protein
MQFDVREFFAELFYPDAPADLHVMGARAAPAESFVADAWAKRASAALAGVADDDRRQMFRDLFEERAGIFECDCGLARDEAERLAFEHVRNRIRRE